MASSARIYIGTGAPVQPLVLSEPNKSKDKSITLYRCTNSEGKRVGVQFGKGTQSLVPCKVISFQDQKDSSKTKRIMFVNAEWKREVATDVEAIMNRVCDTLYEGRAMFWPGKPLGSLSREDLRASASVVLKNNKLTDELEALVKCRDATMLTPGTKFYKMAFDEDKAGKRRMVRKEIVAFEGSARAYEGLISCQLGVYTGFQNKNPTWGIYFTASEAYLADPNGEVSGRSTAVAASETVCLDDDGDDGIEMVTEESRLLISSTGDREVEDADLEQDAEVGNKRSALAPGFKMSKRQR